VGKWLADRYYFLVPTLQRGNAYLAIISTNGWPTGITRLGTLDLF
jgi:hypothetical protein